jgi:hypothetical protein
VNVLESAIRSPYYKSDYLQDAEVEDWLSQSGQFATDARCFIRVLLCERLDFERLDFAMSRRSFLSTETTFGLPPETLPILYLHRGQYNSSVMWNEGDGNGSMRSVGKTLDFRHNKIMKLMCIPAVTIKSPQMFKIGNLGLSLVHTFESGTTMAFIHGCNIWTDTLNGKIHVEPHHARIEKLIRSTRSLWTHPLLLPLVLLRNHLLRAEILSSKLSREVTGIENALGVGRTGRLTITDIGVTDPMKKLFGQEEKRIELMSRLTSAATNISNVTRVLKWDKDCMQFLHQVKDQIDKYRGQSAIILELEWSGLMQFMCCHAESAGDFTVFLHSRLESQLNVVCETPSLTKP